MKKKHILCIASLIIMTVTGCSSPPSKKPLPEDVKAEIEGMYAMISSEYPEGRSLDTGYAFFRISGGTLSGFLFHEGTWEEIGSLEQTEISEKKAEEICRDAVISQDYAIDIPGIIRTMKYRTSSGSTEYCLALPRTGSQLHIACLRNGQIEWMKQLAKKEEPSKTETYAAYSSTLPDTLDLDIIGRTYSLEIPSVNQISEGTFRFNNGELILKDENNGREYFFAEEENGYIFLRSDEETSSPLRNARFINSAWKYLRDVYGSVSVDLDGDGVKETVMLGDVGFSGPLGLTVAVDSAGTDALKTYTAEHGDISLLEEDGHLYGKIIYTPWQKESYERRFEIRWDGSDITLTDEAGNIITDHIDLTEKQ